MLRAFGHHVASCCDMLGIVGSNLTIFKLEPTTPNMSHWVKFDSGAIFLDQSKFLVMLSNQWDCFILFRHITSNGFFSCLPKSAKADFRLIERDFEIKSWSCMFFYCIKQIDSMLPCVCSRTSVTHSLTHPCATRSYHILTSSVIYYWTDARQRGLPLSFGEKKYKPYLQNASCPQNYISTYIHSTLFLLKNYLGS